MADGRERFDADTGEREESEGKQRQVMLTMLITTQVVNGQQRKLWNE